MDKRYIVKIYTKAWVFKETIQEIMSKIDYDYQKNWWQWQLNILLNRDYSNTSIIESDFIKVYLYDDNFKNWKLIYTGIIEEINRNYKETENSLELVTRWLSSILTRLYYNQSWYTFTKTDTASNIIKSVITYANTHYNWFNISGISDTIWNITIAFDYNNCFDSINKVIELTNLFWYIWEDGTCYFNTSPTTHKLTAQKDVQNIDIQEDGSEIINKVIVKYNWGTTSDQNTTSITNYGLFEAFYTKTDLDVNGANAFITETLAKSWIKQKTSLEINNSYILENFKPWDIVKLQNINYSINTTIEKINYNGETATLYLDKYDSIWKILK